MEEILGILQDLKDKSGLAISIHKTCFFSSGLSPAESTLISTSTGLTHASLLVRYLGVPLCTMNLNLVNCALLLQKIKGRLSTWTIRSLSFASIRQLLSSVISGITNFWSSSFILPKRCIEIVNSMCGEFLWKETVETHHYARVAWVLLLSLRMKVG